VAHKDAAVKVAVGSRNPTKLDAVRAAFEAVFPKRKWQIVGADVCSGVPDQPLSDEAGVEGAANRAKEALAATSAEYGVGLEGALQEIGGRWFEAGWMVVVDARGTVGVGASARLEVPPRMMELIREGLELGEVCDRVFNETNSKQAQGFFGLATGGAISRMQGYRDGVVMALAALLHPELYDKEAK
jgi:inosine/xanthosine triphosphatase